MKRSYMVSKATLYCFHEGSAHPEIREENVAIGEKFGFPIEYEGLFDGRASPVSG